MPHPSKQTDVSGESKEKLVQAILEEIDRSYMTAGATGPSPQLADFFRKLDPVTLRTIAYRHGVFEAPLEDERREVRDS